MPDVIPAGQMCWSWTLFYQSWACVAHVPNYTSDSYSARQG